jgi:hypothetical protein
MYQNFSASRRWVLKPLTIGLIGRFGYQIFKVQLWKDAGGIIIYDFKAYRKKQPKSCFNIS